MVLKAKSLTSFHSCDSETCRGWTEKKEKKKHQIYQFQLLYMDNVHEIPYSEYSLKKKKKRNL